MLTADVVLADRSDCRRAPDRRTREPCAPAAAALTRTAYGAPCRARVAAGHPPTVQAIAMIASATTYRVLRIRFLVCSRTSYFRLQTSDLVAAGCRVFQQPAYRSPSGGPPRRPVAGGATLP